MRTTAAGVVSAPIGVRATARAALGVGLTIALATSGVSSALAQDGPSAEPTPIPVTTASGRPDLYLDMPYYLGGAEPEIVMTRGEEHFAGLAADDATRLELEGLLDAVGAQTEDLVSGYALVSLDDLFAFVVALRVDGAEPGTLGPLYLPLLVSDLEDASSSETQVAGKDVTVVTSVGEDGEFVELYVYDEGDTIWMVQAPLDVVEITIAELPSPLGEG